MAAARANRQGSRTNRRSSISQDALRSRSVLGGLYRSRSGVGAQGGADFYGTIMTGEWIKIRD